ncbi:MAG: VCBS repeat-containing protein [Candidatus Delongbacteria bacterium]|jgi:hypothetical protein|nr:VCBS repeat-containing protein [Candidatus Delongbacteria bacterium]
MKKLSFCSLLILAILISRNLYSQDKSSGLKHFADFKRNEQYSDKKSTNQVVLKDLDNDGDLDAVCANMGYNYSQVLFNDGKGNFSDSGQDLTQQGHGVGVNDLNGDGTLDILITCAGYKSGNEKEYNNLPSMIYFNNGKGQFQDIGENLGDKDLSGNAVHLVDIDLDKDIDVVVEYNQNPNILYLNNGKGHFTKSDIMIPENPLFLDIDADGDIDIFCREFGRGYKMLINDRGEFSEYWTVKDSTIVHGAASFGDIDNDKDLDIVFTNGNRNFNSPSKVLLNDGKGYFKDSGQKLSTSIFGRICVGDLNGDKSPDLFITSLGEPAVVWSNDGSGNFTLTNSKIGTQSPFQRPVIKDLDNDGLNDMFIANFDGGSNQYSNEIWLNQKNRNKSDIEIKENIGGEMQNIDESLSYSEIQSPGFVSDSTWAENYQISFVTNGQSIQITNSWDIKLVDINGDGNLDAYFSSKTWLNNGNGNFSKTNLSFGSGIFASFGDLNGDGFVDVVCQDSIYLNDGDNHYEFKMKLSSDILMYSSVLADVDNDGDIDIISCSTATDRILFNDGKSNFTDSGKSLGGWGQASYTFGDINSDDFTDIYVAIPHTPPPSMKHTANKIWFGSAENNFTESSHDITGAVSRNAILYDFDNDGDIDLFLASNSNAGNMIFFNDGKGNFKDSGQVLGNNSNAAKTADFDGDGDFDLFICYGKVPMGNGASNKIWINDGNGYFTDNGLSLGNSNSAAIALGDINKDGKTDAVIVNVKLDPKNNYSSVSCPVEIWLNKK